MPPKRRRLGNEESKQTVPGVFQTASRKIRAAVKPFGRVARTLPWEINTVSSGCRSRPNAPCYQSGVVLRSRPGNSWLSSTQRPDFFSVVNCHDRKDKPRWDIALQHDNAGLEEVDICRFCTQIH